MKTRPPENAGGVSVNVCVFEFKVPSIPLNLAGNRPGPTFLIFFTLGP